MTHCDPHNKSQTDSQADFLAKQLRGYRLTTADIIYRRPDSPDFLQSYIWQELDVAPQFPVMSGFLEFWKHNLDGELHSVRVAGDDLVKPAEFRLYGRELKLH